MSAFTYAMHDSVTMLRRNLRHMLRYPAILVGQLMMPCIMLLLFGSVFGGALSAGFGSASPAGASYTDYITPGVIVMSVCLAAGMMEVSVASDITQGIIARFRTMAISQTSVLTGHVIGTVMRTLTSIGLVVGIALVMGFRPNATPVRWLAAIALVGMLSLAISWLSTAIGLATKTPEGANGAALPLQFLAFLSSAFVRPDSMPGGLRWFPRTSP